MCVGLICLIVKPNQIWPMIRTGLTTIFGGFVGLMLYPMILGNSSGNDALGVIGMGGLIGFAIGCSMTASQCQKRETMQQDKSKNESATLSEELNEHHVPLVYPRWLKGFGIQLVAYISVLLIGFFAGFRHLNEESSVTATIALATAIGFAVTLVGSIIFCLATIVTSRERYHARLFLWQTNPLLTWCTTNAEVGQIQREGRFRRHCSYSLYLAFLRRHSDRLYESFFRVIQPRRGDSDFCFACYLRSIGRPHWFLASSWPRRLLGSWIPSAMAYRRPLGLCRTWIRSEDCAVHARGYGERISFALYHTNFRRRFPRMGCWPTRRDRETHNDLPWH